MTTYAIGEVLDRLKAEFDDITISKIRFLESEGLITPDRTDSGYRRFTDEDIARLRYVLRSQRERYLPLKVIKEELERIDAGQPVPVPVPPLEGSTRHRPLLATRDAIVGDTPPTTVEEVDLTPPPDVQLTLGDLADATGLEPKQVQSLRDHGLLSSGTVFDGEDLRIARAAAALLERGLEARHVRMYLQFADRELSVYEQLVTPLLKQRNPDSRAAASDQLRELVRLGSHLHAALVARGVRSLLRP